MTKEEKKSVRKGIRGLSAGRRQELLDLAKKVSSSSRSKKVGGSKSLPEPFNFSDSWAEAAPINLDRKVGGRRKKLSGGGEETDGATFLPPQFFNPNAPMPVPNDANKIMSAYGKINAVSGSCVNLAPFPDSSGQQTGGKKKKSTTKKTTTKKPAKKTTKKSKGMWNTVKGMF